MQQSISDIKLEIKFLEWYNMNICHTVLALDWFCARVGSCPSTVQVLQAFDCAENNSRTNWSETKANLTQVHDKGDRICHSERWESTCLSGLRQTRELVVHWVSQFFGIYVFLRVGCFWTLWSLILTLLSS